MKKHFTLIFFLFVILGFGQTKGSILGQIKDKDFDAPFGDVNVTIKGTTQGVVSNEDGLYEIPNLEAGKYTVVYSYQGYKTQEAEIEVQGGKVSTANVQMTTEGGAETLDLIEFVITTRKESEAALMIERKNAVEMQQSIGAEELSRKGVSDVEGAVTKIAGVNKQEGVKNVYVRGLGDRYNSTTFNNLPMPSDDPEYKNISLDMFTTDIISSVDVQKVFRPLIYGEVGGANININSKEFYGDEGELSINSSIGVNTRAIGEGGFLRRGGKNYFGFANGRSNPITSLNGYNFRNGYQPVSQNGLINTSLGISYGNAITLKNDGLFAFSFTGKAKSGYRFYEGVRRQVSSIGEIGQDLDYKQSIYNSNQIFMFNSKYTSPENIFSLRLNSGYIHSNSEKVGENVGFDPAGGDDQETITYLLRQQQNDNNIYINQLLATYDFSSNFTFDFAGSYNILNGYEPDTKLSTFNLRDDGQYTVALNSAGDNQRLYIELEEKDLNLNGYGTYHFGNEDDEFRKSLKLGYNYRNSTQDFNSITFAHARIAANTVVDINNIDGFFNQNSVNSGLFELSADRGFGNNALDPVFYNGEKTIHSVFTEFIYPLNDKWTFDFGLRFEDINQELSYDFAFGAAGAPRAGVATPIQETYFLPSFNMKYNLDDNNIFRFAASQTYILPRFKEIAPFIYNDISFDSFGNPFLLPSDVYNVDLNFEHYFSDTELISVTTFYKYIENPMNRAEINSAGSFLSYINVPKAFVYGVEFEARKDIINFGEESGIDFGLNASYLYSQQDLEDVGSDQLSVDFTKDSDQLQGASPLTLNADIKFEQKLSNESIFKTDLVFNYSSNTIYAIGVNNSENIELVGIPTLDLITSYELKNNLKFNLGLKNILDPEFKLTKTPNNGGEDIDILTFNRGVDISLGVSYSF